MSENLKLNLWIWKIESGKLISRYKSNEIELTLFYPILLYTKMDLTTFNLLQWPREEEECTRMGSTHEKHFKKDRIVNFNFVKFLLFNSKSCASVSLAWNSDKTEMQMRQ